MVCRESAPSLMIIKSRAGKVTCRAIYLSDLLLLVLLLVLLSAGLLASPYCLYAHSMRGTSPIATDYQKSCLIQARNYGGPFSGSSITPRSLAGSKQSARSLDAPFFCLISSFWFSFWFCCLQACWLLQTVCMPKAQFGFRRSNPFELKVFEAQDLRDIRAHTKFQLPKC